MAEDEPESWMDHLSDAARVTVDSIDLRRHNVDLERVQRIHLDIDTEEMVFSAASIADMLSEVADRCDEREAFTIRAVVNALRGTDSYHELILKQKKRGKFVDPNIHGEKHDRQMKWLWWLAYREKAGVKTESAIIEIASREGASRATVFAAIKAAEQYLESGRAIFPESENFNNPRPAKDGKG